MIRPVNLLPLLPCSYKVTYVQFFTQNTSRLLFSSPHHKMGRDQMSFLWDPVCGFSVVTPQGCSCWLVKTLTLLYRVVTPGTVLGEVVERLSWEKTEQGICGPRHGLILSHVFSCPVGSCVLHDYVSPLYLRLTLLFGTASGPVIFIWCK